MIKRSQINTIKLNSIVAEHVLGYTISTNCVAGEAYTRGGIQMSKVADFMPATDIADAWTIIRKLQKDGIVTSVSTYGSCNTSVVMIQENKAYEVTIRSDSAPIAICMAALRLLDIRESPYRVEYQVGDIVSCISVSPRFLEVQDVTGTLLTLSNKITTCTRDMGEVHLLCSVNDRLDMDEVGLIEPIAQVEPTKEEEE